ncbi:MAG: pyridoxal phosphate-dependent aminotransferase [Promethearchaeota archaeon]|nr:MAG: pyridoxal phosphate-dependent aminotransferase [Candidatus Lokiarchaeota archaeon]
MYSNYNKTMNSILEKIEESVISKVIKAADSKDVINFAENPNELFTPKSIIENAKEAIEGGFNGSLPAEGRLTLRKLVSEMIARESEVVFDPEEEITITSGASEAFVSSMLSLVEGENGVVIPEPFYENYLPVTELSRGKPIFLSLAEPDYSFHFTDFKKLPTFKVFILNNPHNPTGKVFNSEEIKAIGDTVLEREGYLILDETYKHLLYDSEYFSPLKIDELVDNTIVVGSLSTILSVRGWRLGYIAAKAPIMKEIRKVHYYNSVSAPVPFQWACEDFDLTANFIGNLREKYADKRDFLCRALEKSGFTFYTPDGGYYIFVNFEGVWDGNDWGFYKYLLKNKNVAIVPGSAFYSSKNKGKKNVRITFSQSDYNLKELSSILSAGIT